MTIPLGAPRFLQSLIARNSRHVPPALAILAAWYFIPERMAVGLVWTAVVALGAGYGGMLFGRRLWGYAIEYVPTAYMLSAYATATDPTHPIDVLAALLRGMTG